MKTVKPEDLESFVGQEIGVSDWVVMDQERINNFADVTEDHQFIHVDEAAAKKTPFGGTIAHGFLTLSMLSKLGSDCTLALDGAKMGVNYGFDKIRMMSPVRSGKRIRAKFSLMSASEKVPGQWLIKYAAFIEIEDEAKPALAAEWLTVQMV